MHFFHPFAFAHFVLLPVLLTGALVFAFLRFARRRAFAFADGDGRHSSDHCRHHHSMHGRGGRSDSRSGNSGNAAFDDYRRATLAKLEGEAAEFRTFLDRLRRAADASDFEAFLKSRRERGPETQGGLETS